MTSELEAIKQERDFCRALLKLGRHETIDALLQDALGLLVARVGARETYIEVMRDDGVNTLPQIAAHGCDGARMKEISTFVSRGIISEAIATGETVVTANATEDPRFSEFESVQRHGLESVLCVPIGRDVPVGIVYLQGKRDPASPYAFGPDVERDVELVALALGPPVERISMRVDASPPEPSATDDPFQAVRGKGPAISDVIGRLRLAAPLDVSILLTGPSGSGKTLLANAIHMASRRRSGRFVELNCATLPEALLENELFGAKPGAHSNVPKGGTKGKVDAAQGGTLFLDEIAELSLTAQAKLLQLLQSKTYYRLGGSELQHADVRVIAATNVNLRTAVLEKRFREDLYYRLQVLEARLPSLAERPEDIVPLSLAFLHQIVEKHQLPRKVLSPSAIRAIQSAEWPGNVRELGNRIESAAIHAHLRGSDRIEGRDVFPDESPVSGTPETLQAATRRFQRQHVLSVLTLTDWNVLESAHALDVSRSQVYHLIRSFELKRD
jgi:Nif-specific regulatory protein